MAKSFSCLNGHVVDHVLVDGYPVGDRMLEGVMFKVQWGKSGKGYKASITENDVEYFNQLNEKKWLKAIEDFAAEGLDSAECPVCGEATETERLPKTRSSKPIVIQVAPLNLASTQRIKGKKEVR